MSPCSSRLPALLAVRPVAPGRAAVHGRRVPARLARAPPPRPRALAQRPARRVPRRARRHLPRARVAARALRRPAAPGPHGTAPTAHDGGAAAPLAGRAPVPLAPGLAAAGAHSLDRPVTVRAATAPVLWPLEPPADRACFVRRRNLGLARPRLRPGLAAQTLGTTSSTLASWAQPSCSGFPLFGLTRPGRSGRPGCSSRACSWPICRTPRWRPF